MPRIRLRTALVAVALIACLLWWGAVRQRECPNCREKKLPHRACPKCGAYKGRAVLEVKQAAK